MVRRVFFGLGIALLCVSAVYAANTGRLAGQVLDNDGAALPGVTVQITSAQLIGGPQAAVSGVDGEFAFNLLPPGDYTVEAVLPGFRPQSGEVRVSADGTASVTFRMVPEAYEGEIEVLAEVPVVDTSQVNARQVWDEDYLQRATVGTANRSYQSVLGQAAGVTGGSNPNVFGSTEGENAYLIDGMNTTDTVTGTWATMFNMDSIEEMNFQTGGFEAEFGQATGGIVNLVTKSGGNEFSGSLDIRYRDQSMTENGDHFNRDQEESSNEQYSGALGGPILRDKLWFFTSLQYIKSISDEPTWYFPYDWEGWQGLAKLTWQLSDANRLIGKYSTDPADIPGVNAGITYTDSAKATQEQGGDIWQFELNSVLSESWLLNVQLGTSNGFLKRYSTDQPDTVSGHYNDSTLLWYNAYPYNNSDKRPRDEVRANASWFVDELLGSHEFKGGLEYSEMAFDSGSYYPGGAIFYDNDGNASSSWTPRDLNGDGFFNNYIEVKIPEETAKQSVRTSAELYTVFLQDSWRIHPNLTLKPGVRLDKTLMYNALDAEISDMERWQPRVGAAWDIQGNGRHVVRLSAGRFMDPTTLNIASFASGVPIENYIEYGTLEYYCNASRGNWCTVEDLPASLQALAFDWTGWDGRTTTVINNRGETLSSPARTLTESGLGELMAPYSDQFILAYETQIAPQIALEVTYVSKESGDLIEDTCIGNTWAYGQGEMPSLDDPSTWTLAANCGDWLIVNMAGYERTYQAGILKLEARRSWGQVVASYTYSESKGNNESGPRHYAYGDGDYYPVNFYNNYGWLSDQRDHRVKLNGYFTLPYRFTIGYDAFWSSPGHQTITSTCSAFVAAPGKRSTADQMAALGIDPATLAYCTTPDGFSFGANYTLNHTPRGALETKSVWQLDLQVTKGFMVAGMELEGILTIYNLFGQEFDNSFNATAFRQATETNPDTGFTSGLVYQDDDPNAPYYDEYYGADDSPVLMPIGAVTSYWDPRRYEIGIRMEF
ncbi:MAG TPA: TonB-dependent receptor [Thermoanaerobaculales bacterium]|nr:TonB-dependent receptor [Thermoanaerobaculales bacterium]